MKVLKGDDPSVVEYRLKNIQKVFEQLHCNSIEKLACTVSSLKEEAYQWWTIITLAVPFECVVWELFLLEFHKKFINKLYLEERKCELLYLVQGDMFVAECEREYTI